MNTLSEAPFFTRLLVKRLSLQSIDAELVLEQLGIYEGAIISKLHTAPLGDPITLRIGSQSFALHKKICDQILVTIEETRQ